MRIYLLLMALAAVVTCLATPMARLLAQRTHAMTAVRARDVHTVPIPRLGGVAMLIGFAVTLTIASQMPFLQPVFTGSAGDLPWAILISATVVCLLGVADDIWDLDWVTKLVGQVLAAGFLAWKGVQLIQFPIFGFTTIGSSRLSLVVTVLVVVVAINAVNFVDGLDGLAAGVIAIGGAAFFVFTYSLTRSDTPTDFSDLPTAMMACVVGVCLGFLPHNFFPARIFMGDSGAMFLGLTMSATAILVTGQIDPVRDPVGTTLPALVPILLPLAVLMLPLLDMGLAVVRRLLAGKSPFQPDRMHLHHRLLDFGHSHRRAVLIMYIWTAVVAFSAAAAAVPGVPVPALAIGIAIGVALAIWATLRLPKQPFPRLGR